MNQNKSYHILDNNLPQAYSVQVESRSYYSSSYLPMFPYTDERLLDTIKEYAIKAPFDKIVDRATGISTCTLCGQRYAGYQDKCVAKHYMYKNWRNKYLSREEAVKSVSWVSGDLQEGWMECESQCTWDHQSQFYEQVNFFNMVDLVRSIPSQKDISTIFEHQDCFLPGVANDLILRKALSDINNLQLQLVQHRAVIQEIIDRMQSAGSALSCGL